MKKIVFVAVLLLLAMLSFAVGVETTFTFTGAKINNIFPVYSSSGSTWVPSGTASRGVTFRFANDGNTVCFPSHTGTCDVNVNWDGTNFVIQTP